MSNNTERFDEAVVERHDGNHFYRTFHTRFRMTEGRKFVGDYDTSENGILKHAVEMRKAVLELNGITGVTLGQYEIGVKIAKAFDWDEDKIQAEVLQIINTHMPVEN